MMYNLCRTFAVVIVLLLPIANQLSGSGSSIFVRAEDDIYPDVGDVDEDSTVEIEEASSSEEQVSPGSDATTSGSTEAEEDEAAKQLKPSPDAETTILFTKPLSANELPAGKHVKLLVGFLNKGSKDFVVESMDAAFHYPQDYSYYIQNFTTYRYHRTVEPNREATFDYGFTPSESFSSRPFGLTINLNYRDADGNYFVDAVYNSTITVTDPDEGLDGETFFLYVFLAAVVVLLIFGAHQLLTSFGKRRLMSSKPKAHVETGTQGNKDDVDYDWLPKETLDSLNKSPGRSPKSKSSPRQRAGAAKRRTGGADD